MGNKHSGQINCKNCGAAVVIDADRRMARCEYCKASWYLAPVSPVEMGQNMSGEELQLLNERRRVLSEVLKAKLCEEEHKQELKQERMESERVERERTEQEQTDQYGVKGSLWALLILCVSVVIVLCGSFYLAKLFSGGNLMLRFILGIFFILSYYLLY